ncbi:MAG: hypothetical protein AAB554_05125 [Patescibacteria group bacterium]
MPSTSSNPRAFFRLVTHLDGLDGKTGVKRVRYDPGDVIRQQGERVRTMLMILKGDVGAHRDGKHACTYIPGMRSDAIPVLSASDYCFSRPSTYRFVASTPVELITLDTRVIVKMGLRDDIFSLFRSMLLFSDMGVDLREALAEEYARTTNPCFDPSLSENEILRFYTEEERDACFDFTAREMGRLTIERIVRSDQRSTAIVALVRPPSMTSDKSF